MLAFGGICHGESAQELARSNLDSVRDTTHQEKLRIVWPRNASEARPLKGSDVFLIQGYIDYTCTRIVWSEGRGVAQRVKLTRSWFYNPHGETYSAVEFPVTTEQFAKSWNAAALIRGARAEWVNPLPPTNAAGGWRSISASRTRSSHEQTFFVRIRGGNPLGGFEWALRGTSSTEGVRDFDEIQTLAVFNVFATLTSPDPGEAFDLRSWGPFLTDLLREQGRALASNGEPPHGSSSELLVEISLRLLGQIGWEPALAVIEEIDETAGKAESGGSQWPERVFRESRIARAKIALRQRFDVGKARDVILNSPRDLNADVDLIQWARDRWFEADSDGYFTFLSANLGNPEVDERIQTEDLTDLQKRYPGRGRELMVGVLGNPSSEVVSAAALALLSDNPGDSSALEALQRLASDTGASIPDNSRWFNHFGRERALDYLFSSRSPVPAAFRWGPAQVRKQLAVVGEDGRMVNRLLSALHILENTEPSADEKVAAYRRSLECRSEPGRAAAREALRELDAKD